MNWISLLFIMDWISLLFGLIIGWILGKFWEPVTKSLAVLQTELQKATAENKQVFKEQTPIRKNNYEVLP